MKLSKVISILSSTIGCTVLTPMISAQNMIVNPNFEVVKSCKIDDGIPFWKWEGNIQEGVHICFDSTKYDLYKRGLRRSGQQPRVVYQGYSYSNYKNPLPKEGYGYHTLFYNLKPPKFKIPLNVKHITGKLIKELRNNQLYYFKLYIRRGSRQFRKANGVWIYFSKEKIKPAEFDKETGSYLYWEEIVEEHENWEKREGYFRAQGGEKYITIASMLNEDDFKTKSMFLKRKVNSISYYIDDLYLTPVDEDSVPVKWDAPVLYPLRDSLVNGRAGTQVVIDTLLLDTGKVTLDFNDKVFYPQLSQICMALMEDKNLTVKLDFAENYEKNPKIDHWRQSPITVRTNIETILNYIVERTFPEARQRIEIGFFENVEGLKKDRYPYLVITKTDEKQ